MDTYIDLGTAIHHIAQDAFILLEMWRMLRLIAPSLMRTIQDWRLLKIGPYDLKIPWSSCWGQRQSQGEF